MNEKTLAALRQEVRSLMPPHGTHGFEHVERVYVTCQHIGIVEKADLDILLPAALLHDIAREEENHAQTGAEKAKPILYRYGQPEETIEKITAAIATHSFSGKKPPKTLEAKILSDADKLDALGAIGIYRTAVYSGEYTRPIEDFVAHFHEKLLKLEGLLFTDEAKRMAGERTRYMVDFLTQLEKELK
ncbi:TPA: HD domain-containing protein [Candidatus Bathyarchaeota archaeon]|nr:HD domain-containing protein [Candidatus Bathyarchaeota archaeon]